MPRGQGTILLIPVMPHGLGTILRQRRITVLQSGRIAGSVLVRVDHGTVPVMALLRAGVVPVGVPAALCGTRVSP